MTIASATGVVAAGLLALLDLSLLAAAFARVPPVAVVLDDGSADQSARPGPGLGTRAGVEINDRD